MQIVHIAGHARLRAPSAQLNGVDDLDQRLGQCSCNARSKRLGNVLKFGLGLLAWPRCPLSLSQSHKRYARTARH